ncbi:large conductance mechanosensitive channel protein MscL [Cellulomonas fengjieae]|uniref:large conductance mechanosensitive channel protein MscL n=1 Tax=Cellulomonas fengjieae TaxID=2819978 RepID=UPI0027DE5089|nr:large conductance mechanosensitive channel protein MscL [Cellulomonas fengjieae]
MTDRINSGISGARQGLKGTAKVLQGFKDFISRGNAVELAVGVVIGAAFTAVVTAFVDGLISPLIAAVFGQTDLSGVWAFEINDAVFSIGLILNALIQFLFTAAAVYFFIVLPLNAMAARRKRGQEDEPEAPSEDILLLQEIRDLLAARPSPAIANDAGAGATTGTPTGPQAAAGGVAAGGVADSGTATGSTGSDLPPSIPPGPDAPPKPL